MTGNVESMAQVARDFCALVDRFGGSRDEADAWLEELAEILPRLNAGIEGVQGMGESGEHFAPPAEEARFELFTRLYEAIGERDGYSYEYDNTVGQRLSGSLADDITDIYFDLKRGLELMESNPAQPEVAAKDWTYSYRLHWRHHIDDAERQIHRATAA